jgi:KDO2-lipid IV(A) lauroyltransferase
MRFIIGTLLKYRTKVIINNLKKAFPEKDEKELNHILHKTYKNLIDNISESLKAFTMRKSVIIKRHKLINPEVLAPLLKRNKSIIAVTGHYGNWEWGSLSASLQIDCKVAALYKPLSNKYIDSILRKSRSRCGTELIPIYNTSEMFEKYKNEQYIYLMAADQSPSKDQLKDAYWINFLGTRTAFLHGLEKHSKQNNHAVVFININRVKRGYYECKLDVLTENPLELEEGELTKRYAKKLEEMIIKKPEDWLWSHKRWKHNYENYNSK